MSPAELVSIQETSLPPEAGFYGLVAEPPAAARQRHGTYTPWLVAAAVIIAALAYIIVQMNRAPRRSVPGESMKVTRFTTTSQSLDGAISPDGKYVAAGSADRTIHYHRVADRERTDRPSSEAIQDFATTLDFSPDGRWLYAGTARGVIERYETVE